MTIEEHIGEMNTWLLKHYEDPNERLPYESREGGYIPIYGPLEYTLEILQNNFGEDVADNIIDELANELGEYELWSPVPDESWYDEKYGEMYSPKAVEDAFSKVVLLHQKISAKKRARTSCSRSSCLCF